MDSSELRFVNNLAVMLECGRPLLSSLESLAKDQPEEESAYQALIKCTREGGDFTSVLAEFPQLCSRSSLALLKAARRSNCLAVLMPKLARLVRAKCDGDLDPRQRFFETWALMVESGFSTLECLGDLRHDFTHGPLGEMVEGLRQGAQEGKSLALTAQGFPEVFNATSCDLLTYGEARDLAFALRAITRLI